jgi:hypothetical protein
MSTKVVICCTGLGKVYRGSGRCSYIDTYEHTYVLQGSNFKSFFICNLKKRANDT